MHDGTVEPTQGTNAIGPTESRTRAVAPDPIRPIGTPRRRPNTSDAEMGQFDRMEIHGDGAPRRAYAKFLSNPRSGEVSIAIIDADTHKVIRELPSEEVVKMADELQAYWDARTRVVED